MRPLTGIRVVDASSYLAGSFATLMLADLGAEVIKVEAPKGDPLRRFGYRPTGAAIGANFAAVNRDKRSVVLDLRSDDGRECLLRLLADADVFVQNWRPGVSDRLRLTDSVLHDCNAQLLEVAITGYGASGPDAATPAFDSVMQAHTGLCTTYGKDETPRLIGTFIADKITGVMAAEAIVAGLYGRERGSGGGRIEVSMLDSVAYFDAPDLLETRMVVGESYPEPARIAPANTLVACMDGHIVVAPTSGAQIQRAFAALGHPEWSEQLRTIPNSTELAKEMMRLLSSATADRTVADCLERLAGHDVPAAQVLDLDGHLTHRQVQHNGTYPLYHDPHLGTVRRARYPGLCSAWSPPPVSTGAPALGEHTDAILAARADTGT